MSIGDGQVTEMMIKIFCVDFRKTKKVRIWDVMEQKWKLLCQTATTGIYESKTSLLIQVEDRNDPEKILLKHEMPSSLAAKEKEAEMNKKIEGLNEIIEQLTKQIRLEQLKHKRPKSQSHDHGSFRDMPGIEEAASVDPKDSESKADSNVDEKGNNNEEMNNEEIQQLLNRLQDTEQYVKDLQDERRQHDFEVELQIMDMGRQYKLEIRGLNLDLSEERNKCEDLERQIETDDLNLVASEFREELWVARNYNKELRKAHLGEINELEMYRDELLREINSKLRKPHLEEIIELEMASNQDQLVVLVAFKSRKDCEMFHKYSTKLLASKCN